MAADDEEGRQEEAGEEGPWDEDGLEGENGSRRAESRRNGRVAALVEPLGEGAGVSDADIEERERTRDRESRQNSKQRAFPATVIVLSSPRVKPRRASRETM